MNSNFFHRALNFRRKTNKFLGMQIDGAWIEEVDKVKKGVFNYFKRHFNSSGERRPKMAANTSDRWVSEEDNSMLMEPFSEQEVKDAIACCDSSKNPGPDSLNFRFIKECWEIIKADFMKMLGDFHHNGKLVRGFNPRSSY